jgi:hypothetical protein
MPDRFELLVIGARRVIGCLAAGRLEEAQGWFAQLGELLRSTSEMFGTAVMVAQAAALCHGAAPQTRLRVELDEDQGGVDPEVAEALAAFLPAAHHRDLVGAWYVWDRLDPCRQVDLIWTMACEAAPAVRDGRGSL